MRGIFLLVFLTGCAPYVGYTHLSSPEIADDGYDLVCGGVKVERGLEMSAAWCENLNSDWSGVKLDVEYVWR